MNYLLLIVINIPFAWSISNFLEHTEEALHLLKKREKEEILGAKSILCCILCES